MNAADIQRVEQWLASHNVSSCPACQGQNLEVKSQVGVLMPVIKNQLVTPDVAASLGLGGVPMMPVVSVMCSDCSHVLLFGAQAIGVN